MEQTKLVNGHRIYIGGTWCEVYSPAGKLIWSGEVAEDIKHETVYQQVTKDVVFFINGKEVLRYTWLHEDVDEERQTRKLLASEHGVDVKEVKAKYEFKAILDVL